VLTANEVRRAACSIAPTGMSSYISPPAVPLTSARHEAASEPETLSVTRAMNHHTLPVGALSGRIVKQPPREADT
jgi:hypothetical protein